MPTYREDRSTLEKADWNPTCWRVWVTVNPAFLRSIDEALRRQAVRQVRAQVISVAALFVLTLWLAAKLSPTGAGLAVLAGAFVAVSAATARGVASVLGREEGDRVRQLVQPLDEDHFERDEASARRASTNLGRAYCERVRISGRGFVFADLACLENLVDHPQHESSIEWLFELVEKGRDWLARPPGQKS